MSEEESEASVPSLRLGRVCDHAQGEGDHGGGHSAEGCPSTASSSCTGTCCSCSITGAKCLSTKPMNTNVVWRYMEIIENIYLSFARSEFELEAKVPCGIVT